MKKNATKGNPQTILVIDDDPEWLDFLCRAIGAEYPVLSATNGEDAVRRAQRACPDVIILDVMLPGGRDGFAIFAELQNDPRTREIPVLMLSEVNRKTGLDFGTEEMNRYLGKTPAAFLEKPISAERLLDAVRDVLGHGESDQAILEKTGGTRLSRPTKRDDEKFGRAAQPWSPMAPPKAGNPVRPPLEQLVDLSNYC